MKKKIAILGSTGSIGKTLIKIILKDKKNFDVVLLTAEKNHNKLFEQAKLLKVKNLIITNKNSFNILKKKIPNKKYRIFNNFNCINKIFKSKIDYTMSSISGLKGLKPTLDMIKFSKKIAIANKESIICGWSLIKKALKKNKTKFIPVDSEHFSIWSLINENEKDMIDKVYITASGGPFLKWSLNKVKNVSPQRALKHPNWSMGKKISIDSATMMNKVFEVIETQKIFNLPKSQVGILIHEKSYVHAIVQFKNGLKKILAHDTNMTIPIFNTIYQNEIRNLKTENLNIKKLNDLNFKSVDLKRFPLIKILDGVPSNDSLYETVLITINDFFVHKFLSKRINFEKLIHLINKFSKIREFQKFKKIKPKNIKEIYNLQNYVSLKMKSLGI